MPRFIKLLTTLMCFSLFVVHAEKKRLNVLFIISDDLTAEALGSYGNKIVKTPHIDKLASEGTRFTQTFCQFPVCGPSRASFMTGYYPHATQTFGYVSGRKAIGPDRVTWSQNFINNGYYAARVSKIYHMGVPIHIEQGSNGSDDPASWTERFNSQGPEWLADGDAELVQNNPNGKKPRKGGNVMTIVKATGDDYIHSDGKAAKKASELIRKHKNKPFFLAVGFVRPHVPFVAPKKDFEHYPWQNIDLPEVPENDWNDIPRSGINYVNSKNARMTTDQKKKAVAAYYASVTYMDRQVGKVLKTLKDEGLEDNTIIIFTSDHGFFLGEHEFWMKVGLMDESSRVPMIIKVPGQKPSVCHSFTELIDLYPTISSLAGIPYPKEIQGKNISKMIEDPSYEVRDAAFSVSRHAGKNMFLLRNKNYAFIQHGEFHDEYELFDMDKDPNQFTNQSKNPEYKAVLESFKKSLADKLAEVRDNDLGIDYEAYKKKQKERAAKKK